MLFSESILLGKRGSSSHAILSLILNYNIVYTSNHPKESRRPYVALNRPRAWRSSHVFPDLYIRFNKPFRQTYEIFFIVRLFGSFGQFNSILGCLSSTKVQIRSRLSPTDEGFARPRRPFQAFLRRSTIPVHRSFSSFPSGPWAR